MQLKVNLQRAVNNPTPIQQVKYPAKRNTVTWWQRRRDVCCQQTGEQTAPCLTALPVHLQAVSAHFIALHSCLGLCAPGCGRRAVRLQQRLQCRRRLQPAEKSRLAESGPAAVEAESTAVKLLQSSPLLSPVFSPLQCTDELPSAV